MEKPWVVSAPQPPQERPMTVLQVRPADHGCDVIVAECLRRQLEASLGRVVRIRLNAPQGDRIEAVWPLP